MKKVKIHRINAFAKQLACGNPTATVIDASQLTEQEMKNIAIEMNCPETAFILPSVNADMRLRYYTCSGDEIRFCGHATIGALEAIYCEGLFNVQKTGRSALRIETNAGVLSMEIQANGPAPYYKMDLPKIDLVPAPYSLEELRQAINVPAELIDRRFPLMLETKNRYLYFAIPSLEHMQKIQVDMNGLKAFAQKNQIVVFCALTPHAFNAANQVHCRGFAPLVGVPEDPFTGSMQGGIAAYLLKHKMIPENTMSIGTEQGHFIGRPGEAKISVTNMPELQAHLLAQAVSLYTTEMQLP